MEALGGRFNRNLQRLRGAITFAALVIGGSLLVLAPVGGWNHVLGEAMVISGIVGMVIIRIGALRYYDGQR